MEVVMTLDTKSPEAKALYQYLKTLPFIELKNDKLNEKENTLVEKEEEILQISKSINKKGSEKWFAKKGIAV